MVCPKEAHVSPERRRRGPLRENMWREDEWQPGEVRNIKRRQLVKSDRDKR